MLPLSQFVVLSYKMAGASINHSLSICLSIFREPSFTLLIRLNIFSFYIVAIALFCSCNYLTSCFWFRVRRSFRALGSSWQICSVKIIPFPPFLNFIIAIYWFVLTILMILLVLSIVSEFLYSHNPQHLKTIFRCRSLPLIVNPDHILGIMLST